MKSDSIKNHNLSPATSSFFTGKDVLAGAQIVYHRDPDYCISLLDLTPIGQWLDNSSLQSPQPTDYLSVAEQELFASFSYKKRQKQWLGGRLALKHSILNLIAENTERERDNFTDLSILSHQSGKPEPVLAPQCKADAPAVSLSHSEHWAVGIAARAGSCGIDIQKITERILNVSARFTEQAELSLLKNEPTGFSEIEQLVMLWSAKEAVKKSLLHDQPTIFAGIQLRNIRQDRFHQLDFVTPAAQQPRAEVTALRLGDFMLAFTLENTCHA